MLADWVLANMQCKRKVIISPKNDRRLAALYPPIQTQKYTIKDGTINIVVPPNLTDEREYDPWFWPIWEQGNCVVLIDEFHIIATARRWPPTLQSIVRLGADRGIGEILTTQRTTQIALFAKSEADHFFVYRQQVEVDRKALEQDTGVSWEAAKDLEKYRCLYYQSEMDAPQEWGLNSKGLKYLDLYNSGEVKKDGPVNRRNSARKAKVL